ncbi:MAG: flavodoxin [Chitinivibrionales bacterium]|nr:flavodoxin [Chitinivibrionales bacterium]
MAEKILVTYASKSGSTAEIAVAISEALRESGYETDIIHVSKVTDVSSYRGVIIGSGIYMGRWLRSAMKFIRKNKTALQSIPVAFFSVCLLMKEDTEENRKTAEAYFDGPKSIVSPFETATFAGALEIERLPILYKIIVKSQKEKSADYRNYDNVKKWAKSVGEKIARSVGRR